MHERSASTSGGTIAWIFDGVAAAEAGSARLRAAGFSDVRVSENAGTTAAEHVPENAGLTASDFEERLVAAGFRAHDARDLTDAVRRGGVLLTLAAGARVDRAFAVLRGEQVAPESLAPVDAVASTPVSSAAVPSAPVPSAPIPSAVVPGAAVPSAPVPSTPVSGERTIELREEQLSVGKRLEQREARVRKEVVTEERTITVPVRSERLVIERDGEPTVRIPLTDDEPA